MHRQLLVTFMNIHPIIRKCHVTVKTKQSGKCQWKSFIRFYTGDKTDFRKTVRTADIHFTVFRAADGIPIKLVAEQAVVFRIILKRIIFGIET